MKGIIVFIECLLLQIMLIGSLWIFGQILPEPTTIVEKVIYSIIGILAIAYPIIKFSYEITIIHARKRRRKQMEKELKEVQQDETIQKNQNDHESTKTSQESKQENDKEATVYTSGDLRIVLENRRNNGKQE